MINRTDSKNQNMINYRLRNNNIFRKGLKFLYLTGHSLKERDCKIEVVDTEVNQTFLTLSILFFTILFLQKGSRARPDTLSGPALIHL